MPGGDLDLLLERDVAAPAVQQGVQAFAAHAALAASINAPDLRRRVEAMIGEIDRLAQRTAQSRPAPSRVPADGGDVAQPALPGRQCGDRIDA